MLRGIKYNFAKAATDIGLNFEMLGYPINSCFGVLSSDSPLSLFLQSSCRKQFFLLTEKKQLFTGILYVLAFLALSFHSQERHLNNKQRNHPFRPSTKALANQCL